jgi:hypothetical protein
MWQLPRSGFVQLQSSAAAESGAAFAQAKDVTLSDVSCNDQLGGAFVTGYMELLICVIWRIQVQCDSKMKH